MSQSGGRRPDEPPSDETEDATRIVGFDEFENDMTRIVPFLNDPKAGDGTIISMPGLMQQRSASGAAAPTDSSETVYLPVGLDKADQNFDPVVGWLVITRGPGRGHHSPIFYGQNTIGRAADQRIRLDFGDHRISREAHAYFIYDEIKRAYFIRDNGKANLVRHNGELVLTPTPVKDRDQITIGETTLLFIALCGPDFDWLETQETPVISSSDATKAAGDEPTDA